MVFFEVAYCFDTVLKSLSVYRILVEKFSTGIFIFSMILVSDGFIHIIKITRYGFLTKTANKLIDGLSLHLLHLAKYVQLKWGVDFRRKIVIQSS